ncbi:hypothetical protein P6P90_02820 [Ectobacillus antri]|jgi:hypothetical protein|uniref:Uncharacterized protein n=1 Tax=Ectobacillus antri TaxID=2486280 RepID=A0ABT6H2E3_9BACI|nr:hypothetical protein [Ectobacillus antri]MDG4656258.1 hypothetical protein [Ectobacillus antri]MDG5752933.1 hypothetical protein [Ectobacillus antri]
MEYVFEALVIIISLCIPLVFVVLFLHELIKGLGSSTVITSKQENPYQES